MAHKGLEEFNRELEKTLRMLNEQERYLAAIQRTQDKLTDDTRIQLKRY
jgi:hypothetical protein